MSRSQAVLCGGGPLLGGNRVGCRRAAAAAARSSSSSLLLFPPSPLGGGCRPCPRPWGPLLRGASAPRCLGRAAGGSSLAAVAGLWPPWGGLLAPPPSPSVPSSVCRRLAAVLAAAVLAAAAAACCLACPASAWFYWETRPEIWRETVPRTAPHFPSRPGGTAVGSEARSIFPCPRVAGGPVLVRQEGACTASNLQDLACVVSTP